MKTLCNLFLLIFLYQSFASCDSNSYHTWTDKERSEFETECSNTDTLKRLDLRFEGFEDNEFDSILVQDYKNSILVDSFRVFVSQAQDSLQKTNKFRYASIERTIFVKHKYLFKIQGQKPYELKEIQFGVVPQFYNTSENWECSYILPIITKRNLK